MAEGKNRQGLTVQFTRLLVGAAAGCILLFLVLRGVLVCCIGYYDRNSDFRQRETARRIQGFQDYVTQEHLSTTDTDQISAWARQQDYTLLELYRNQVLVYSSFAPNRDDIGHEGRITPFYDWMPRATITFADGALQVLLYYDPVQAWARWGTLVILAACIGLFMAVFLLGCRRIVRYICLLSQEVQGMENGDLSRPVTVQGSDELTALASCLDSMRLTLDQQRQQEAETSARVKSLITQMSHDLRTPLTTLLLYTEIVASGKYQTQAQLSAYLAKIDAKARQIKQMSDHLFEYALVTRDTVVTLDEPAPFSQIFEEPLAEWAEQLEQHGFICRLELGEEDVSLRVHRAYIRRIFDNITSNILKYADPACPVTVCDLRREGQAGLAFTNVPLQPDAGGAESTKVGLVSIQTMMEKMQGTVSVDRSSSSYCIALLFPLADP